MKKVKLCEIGKIITGCTPSTKKEEYYSNNDFMFVGPSDIKSVMYVDSTEKHISTVAFNEYKNKFINENSIVVDCIGSDMGNVAIIKNKCLTNQQINAITNINCNDYNIKYIYYVLSTMKQYFHLIGTNGSTMPILNKTMFENVEIEVPEKEIQDKIANILSKLDDKIKLNNEINNNLLEIIDNLYKNEFIDIQEYKRAEEIANITIGKTPPRGNKECFSTNKEDVKWISIADLGKCGTYILDTSEKLTKEAVDSYNVKVIPKNTIILSFKLTIGRIAITSQEMTTNEAIAHFNLENKDMIYYLYSYLKNFDYGKLGSTSSIATAVNSKIIKAMPIAIPEKEVLKKYNEKVSSMFEKIRENEIENKNLEQLRDTLLPKLMSGGIDLENIEI